MKSEYSLLFSNLFLEANEDRHENVVSYKEAFFEEETQSLCIVMEFAENGDLQSLIEQHRKKSEFVKEEQIWGILIDLFKGL